MDVAVGYITIVFHDEAKAHEIWHLLDKVSGELIDMAEVSEVKMDVGVLGREEVDDRAAGFR